MSFEVPPRTHPSNVVNIQYWHNVTSSTLDGTEASARDKGSEFIYYRVYHENRAVATKRPAYLNDIYLGRIRSTWVTPPHTAGSLKRCLSYMENIDPTKTKLFASVSNQSALLADGAPISLKSNQTLGIVPEEPVMVLSETMPKAGMLAGTESLRVPPDLESPLAPRFLFYGVYSVAGARASYAPIDAERPWVSKFDLDSILPPVSVTSLLLILYMREGIKASQLLQQDGLTPLGDNQIFTEDGHWLGATAEEHLVLKLGSQRTPFTEGSQYMIQNCCTDKVLGTNLNLPTVLLSSLPVPRHSFSCFKFTLKLQDDGGVAFHFEFEDRDRRHWIGPNCRIRWSVKPGKEHGFCVIPSPTNKNNFFICENDPVSPKAFYDPGGAELYSLELRDWDTTDTKQMWRLIPVGRLEVPPVPESSCFCCHVQ